MFKNIVLITHRQLFQQHLAQTSNAPLALEIIRAEGSYIFDINNKQYLDCISGIAVSNVGHRHPHVIEAIKKQLDAYMHLMVYGEYIQAPQVLLAKKILSVGSPTLSRVYFTNSGSEAVEGALKVAKRYTNRHQLVTFSNTYHGSTHGALSVMGNETFKQAFRPLLPGVQILPYNQTSGLKAVNKQTAAVIVEVIQGEAGYEPACNAWLHALQARCKEVGALLIIDEIQTGFGRTGDWFAYLAHGLEPDIVCMAKGMGGGLPIGAFVGTEPVMNCLTHNPVLGHITTFGGNAVCAAAALAVMEVIENEQLLKNVPVLGQMFLEQIAHPRIKRITGKGLMWALGFGSFAENKALIDAAIEKGVVTDWFLFNDKSMRIAPPLTITAHEILETTTLLKNVFDQVPAI